VTRLVPPVSDTAGELQPASGRAAVPGCGVLVVDDDDGVRGLLDVGLRHVGFKVWLAADGREAVGLYRTHREDIVVVLLDVRMPDPDGPQTLGALRSVNPRVRCCFMSGDLGGYTEDGLLDLGAVAVFQKPFRLDALARILRELSLMPGETRSGDEFNP
jgi:DNA-binding NtrC family response regulator